MQYQVVQIFSETHKTLLAQFAYYHMARDFADNIIQGRKLSVQTIDGDVLFTQEG